MSIKTGGAELALAIAMTAPATAWGMGVGLGCTNLPAYNRAIGALQGISSCDMSVEDARRIIAERDGPAFLYPQGATSPGFNERPGRRRAPHP